jgi:hypothetical protein
MLYNLTDFEVERSPAAATDKTARRPTATTCASCNPHGLNVPLAELPANLVLAGGRCYSN